MKSPWIRSLLALLLTALLVWLSTLGREDLAQVHTWNRAFADAAYLLLCLTLMLGPLARFWKEISSSLAWRRELGIAFTASAILHVVIYAQTYDYNFLRFFTRQDHLTTFLAHDAFAAAMWIGLFALLYALVLTITSNNFSQRLLGKGWKFLQQQSYTLFVLSMLHTFLLLYLVIQMGFGAFKPLFWIASFLAISLQLAGYFKTVYLASRQRRASGQ